MRVLDQEFLSENLVRQLVNEDQLLLDHHFLLAMMFLHYLCFLILLHPQHQKLGLVFLAHQRILDLQLLVLQDMVHQQ